MAFAFCQQCSMAMRLGNLFLPFAFWFLPFALRRSRL
jgi:hypothetical protein